MKILIVDDHALVRRGMGHVVRESFPDAEIVEAGSASDAVWWWMLLYQPGWILR